MMGSEISTDPSSDRSVNLLKMELDIVEDVPAELEEFILLVRLRRFKEARELYKQNLKPHEGFFPVLAEFADMLLEECCYTELSQLLSDLPSKAMFSKDECLLLALMKALSIAYIEQKQNGMKEKPGRKQNLEVALNLAQGWHNEWQQKTMYSLGKVEIQILEIYLSIIALAENKYYILEDQYYQPPQSVAESATQWDGFLKWCISLNEQERFWESQKIFTILILVLSSEKVESLFEEYLGSLKQCPRTSATATVELAATNAYLLWLSRENARDRNISLSIKVFEQSMKVESLLRYLFGSNADLKGGRFDEWQNSLRLLLMNTSPNIRFENGSTPLLWATVKGHESTVRLLLKNKANPNLEDRNGRTPLSWAAGNGHEGIAQLLLENKANVELKDRAGRTPLSWAAGNGHESIVQLLLENKADLNLNYDGNGRTPLSWAAENGYENIVRLLLDNKANPNFEDWNGRTLLSRAAENGHNSVVQLLLEKNADPDSKGRNGRTPLSWAAVNGHESVTKLLLKNKANPSLNDDGNGRTPLSWAAENGYESIVRLLLENKADPDSKDQKGRTPLSWAAVNGHESISKLLLENKADPDSKDLSYRRTPLLWAARYGRDAVVRLLLQKQVELDLKDYFGQTPMSLAAENGHETVVKLLLENRANLESKDQGNRTPLSWAAEKGHESIVRLLLENKADLDSKDQNGQTPLSWGSHEQP